MLSATAAIAKAKGTARWAVGMCDNFVANMFGFKSSGYATAASHWNSIPAADKHPGDANPPAGALVFWGGGAGHVAISTGGGGIISTDYPRSGMVSATTVSSITNGWGKSYLGWSIPVFQGQVGSVSDAAYSIPGLGTLPNIGGSVLDFLTSGFGTDIKDMMERVALMLMGATLLIIGLFSITRPKVDIKSLLGEEEKKSSSEEEKGGGLIVPEEKPEEAAAEEVSEETSDESVDETESESDDSGDSGGSE